MNRRHLLALLGGAVEQLRERFPRSVSRIFLRGTATASRPIIITATRLASGGETALLSFSMNACGGKVLWIAYPGEEIILPRGHKLVFNNPADVRVKTRERLIR